MIKRKKTAHSVEEDTIGQYTGLKDNNGKEIYEGDIVNIVLEENINVVQKAIIEYHGASFYGVTDADMWELDGYQYIEILGNIYDNPDLLEKGEEI